MKKIIYTRSDGLLCVVTPIEGQRLATALLDADGNVVEVCPSPASVDTFRRGWPINGLSARWAETEDEFLARIRPKVVPADAIDVAIVEASAVPAERRFRNAWRSNGAAGITHDLAACKEIHKQYLRRERAPLLTALDTTFMRNLETGKSNADVVAEKQRLRDVTKLVDSCDSLDAIVKVGL